MYCSSGPCKAAACQPAPGETEPEPAVVSEQH